MQEITNSRRFGRVVQDVELRIDKQCPDWRCAHYESSHENIDQGGAAGPHSVTICHECQAPCPMMPDDDGPLRAA